MSLLDEIDANAAQIGAVNTILRNDSKNKGFNTDYLGVINSFKKYNVTVANKHVLILGAGGAGRAAAYGLMKAGAEATVVNRTFAKAKAVAEDFNCQAADLINLQELLESIDILVSAITAKDQIIQENWLKQDIVLFDANYKNSALAQLADRKGNLIIAGEEWLLQQAFAAYRCFLGVEPEEKIMRDTLSAVECKKKRCIMKIACLT